MALLPSVGTGMRRCTSVEFYGYRGGRWVGKYECEAHSSQPIEGKGMSTLLWVIAAVLVIGGVLAIIRKQVIWGIALIVVGLLVGPGGVSLFG